MRIFHRNITQMTFCLLVLLPGALAAATPDFAGLARDQEDTLLADRRHIHENAELSRYEFETQAYLRERLGEIPGVKLIEGEWGTGVVAMLEGGLPGPTVAWRTDMDALPITEKTGLPFACEKTFTTSSGREVGVMHACGHDMHMAISLGIMRSLSRLRDELPGRVLYIGQPAEEVGAGALQLLEAGIFEDGRKPKCALAMHIHPTLELGTVGHCAGWATGNVDGFVLKVKGDGGHGAYPHRGVDPVTLSAEIILALQILVAREIDVNNHAVISVGHIEGGAKSNVIPDEVLMEATVRTQDQATRELLKEKVERTVMGLAAAAGAPEPELEYYFGTAAGYNNPQLVSEVCEVVQRELGEDAPIAYPPGMGGEDFGYFGQVVPGFQFRLGVVTPDDPPMGLHKPDLNPDERALVLGVQVASAAIWDQLQRGGE